MPAGTNVSIENLFNSDLEYCCAEEINEVVLIDQSVSSKKPTGEKKLTGNREQELRLASFD